MTKKATNRPRWCSGQIPRSVRTRWRCSMTVRTVGLTQVQVDGELVALRLLAERRRELVHHRTQTVNRLHQLLTELVPAGAAKKLTASKARTLLGTVRPRDVAGRTRRSLAVDLGDDVTGLDRKLKTLDKQLAGAVAATGTGLTDIVGVGVVTAATILGETADVRRVKSWHPYASYTGTAPIDNSSGDLVRHRLSRAGNRRLNHPLHIVALAHKRHDAARQAYDAKKLAAGKSNKGALRCLKRRLADRVFRALVDDLENHHRGLVQLTSAAGPVGQSGATTKSCATDRSRMVNSSEKPLAGPADPDVTPEPALLLAPA